MRRKSMDANDLRMSSIFFGIDLRHHQVLPSLAAKDWQRGYLTVSASLLVRSSRAASILHRASRLEPHGAYTARICSLLFVK